MPVVSIIVPVFNTKDYLSTCLETLINQTLKNIEIICVNDGSTDGSDIVLEEYAKKDSRVKVIHQKNGGVALARKIGIEAATGQYIGFVDSDDYVELDMYERLLMCIGEADVVLSGYFSHIGTATKNKMINNLENGLYTHENIEIFYKNIIYSFKNDETTNIGSLCTNLFLTSKMKCVIKHINLTIKHWEDFYLLVTYLLDCSSCVVTDECFYHCVYRSKSASNSKHTTVLTEYNQLYIELTEVIQGSAYKEILQKQLDKWFVRIVNASFKQYFKFDKNISPVRYIGDYKFLEDKRIVLYCAGDCAQDVYRQLKDFSYDVILWVDKNYKKYQIIGLDVKSPQELASANYDVVYIAVDDPNTAENIKKELLQMGVEKEKIIYFKPKKLW